MDQHKHRKCIQTGIVVLILNMLEHKVQPEPERICRYHKREGYKEVVCLHMGLTRIPNDLDADIESIHLNHNPLKEIRRIDMMKYKNLKKFLNVKDNVSFAVPLKIERNAFVDLIELKELILSDVNLSLSKFVILPMKLEKISVTYCYLHDDVFDFSTLENLKILRLFFNNLTKVPRYHKYAPLQYVSLTNNSIDYTPLAPIVRYCKLREYYVHFARFNKLTTTGRDKCECRRWAEWYRRKKIKGNIYFGSFLCPEVEPCNEELIPQRYEQLWDDCVNNVRDPSHDLKEDPPPPPINHEPDTTDQLEPANVTPEIEKKPLPKIVYFSMLLLSLIVLLTAMCFYLIFRKKRRQPPVPVYYIQEEEPEQEEEEGLEIH